MLCSGNLILEEQGYNGPGTRPPRLSHHSPVPVWPNIRLQ
jgi:hypothetical protein